MEENLIMAETEAETETDESVTEEARAPVSEIAEAVEEMPDSESELELLRAEVQTLKDALNKKEAEQSKILGELESFNRLFPEISVKDVPEAVWKNVDSGIPLSAAYALYEKETARLSDKAMEINRRNAAMSAGIAGKEAEKEYFSPDEVRAMSQREVHENYSKIQRSMKHWL